MSADNTILVAKAPEKLHPAEQVDAGAAAFDDLVSQIAGVDATYAELREVHAGLAASYPSGNGYVVAHAMGEAYEEPMVFLVDDTVEVFDTVEAATAAAARLHNEHYAGGGYIEYGISAHFSLNEREQATVHAMLRDVRQLATA